MNRSVKFKNEYRIPSTRIKNYDYGANGAYFVTICTQAKKNFFGEICESSSGISSINISIDELKKYYMIYSQLGDIAKKYWLEIPNYFPFITPDEWIVMPNHVHGILTIDRAIYRIKNQDAINRVSTKGGITSDKNPMLYKNLSTVIRWYKGRVAFEARKIEPDFAWQSRFYDHVIRNQKDWIAVSEYIIFNPQNWGESQKKNDDFKNLFKD